MQQYFVNELLCLNKIIKPNPEQGKHISKVMRMRVNDRVRLSDGERVFLSRIISINSEILLQCEEELFVHSEFLYPVKLACAMLKGEKWDLVIQKATELGVTEIFPIETRYSVVKANEKSTNKVLRWNKIALEAAEQSLRKKKPIVHEPKKLSEILEMDSDIKIVAYEKEKETLFHHLNFDAKTILLVIGPEGGFSEAEIQQFEKNEFIVASLGNRILRSETAALYCMSLLGALTSI